MNIKTLSRCLFLPLALAACVETELGAEEAEISNAPATHINRDSILLGLNDGTDTWRCNGLALSKHWILTAAHCVESFPIATTVSGSVRVYATNNSDQNVQIYGTGDTYASARYFRHPNWTGGNGDKNDDIALIRLSGSGIVDSTYTYRGNIYYDNREPWDVGSTEWRFFFVAGYGYGSPDGSSEFCPTASTPRVKRLGMFDLDPSIPNYSGSLVAKARTPYQSDICSGDSGAPYLLLRGGRYMSFAVHSGDHPSVENNGVEFGTLIRPKMAWIESTAAAQAIPLTCSNAVAGGYTYRSCTE